MQVFKGTANGLLPHASAFICFFSSLDFYYLIENELSYLFKYTHWVMNWDVMKKRPLLR